jgi:hypothetical protein
MCIEAALDVILAIYMRQSVIFDINMAVADFSARQDGTLSPQCCEVAEEGPSG